VVDYLLAGARAAAGIEGREDAGPVQGLLNVRVLSFLSGRPNYGEGRLARPSTSPQPQTDFYRALGARAGVAGVCLDVFVVLPDGKRGDDKEAVDLTSLKALTLSTGGNLLLYPVVSALAGVDGDATTAAALLPQDVYRQVCSPQVRRPPSATPSVVRTPTARDAGVPRAAALAHVRRVQRAHRLRPFHCGPALRQPLPPRGLRRAQDPGLRVRLLQLKRANSSAMSAAVAPPPHASGLQGFSQQMVPAVQMAFEYTTVRQRPQPPNPDGSEVRVRVRGEGLLVPARGPTVERAQAEPVWECRRWLRILTLSMTVAPTVKHLYDFTRVDVVLALLTHVSNHARGSDPSRSLTSCDMRRCCCTRAQRRASERRARSSRTGSCRSAWPAAALVARVCLAADDALHLTQLLRRYHVAVLGLKKLPADPAAAAAALDPQFVQAEQLRFLPRFVFALLKSVLLVTVGETAYSVRGRRRVVARSDLRRT
jgi:hypothetical protein